MMAINPARITGANPLERSRVDYVQLELTKTLPPLPRRRSSTSLVQTSIQENVIGFTGTTPGAGGDQPAYSFFESQEPRIEGQLIAFNSVPAQTISILVAVQIDGNLVWKSVDHRGLIRDPNTGRPPDPLSGF